MDQARAFSSWPGMDLDDGPLLLPVAWARVVREVQVVFGHSTYRGWTARVCGDGFVVLDLPWHDDVDLLLDQEGTDRPGLRLPTRAPDERWWDTDQCWEATIQLLGDDLLVAETDVTDGHRELGVPELMEPGRVRVGGAYVSWHRISAEAYDAAWQSARRRLARVKRDATH